MIKLIKEVIMKHNQKTKERNEICNNYIVQIDDALQEIKSVFQDKQSFIEPKACVEWRQRRFQLLAELEIQNIKRLKKALHYKKLLSKQTELVDNSRTFAQQIAHHNNSVAEMKVQSGYELIGSVEGQKLDKQQMKCIVKEVHNHLVIAGAGTGKTTTVVGKIKYLLRTGKYKPEDILVLSFTRDSAKEMSERINRETGVQIEASTFHKLGLNIIAKTNDIKPNITNLQMNSFVKEQLKINMQSEAYVNLLYTYLLFNRVIAKSEFEFTSKTEYEEYLKLNPPMTINQENVKSYGEMDIANFLKQNGIKYIYEHPYEIDTRTNQYGQYKPDFYLPEYNIYIEYFGINRTGEVPAYFNGASGKSASQLYQESMQWKREIHSANQTIMIECYAYEKWEGELLDNLKKKLEEHSVNLQPKSVQELWEESETDGNLILEGLIGLFETLINLIKSNNYTIQIVRQMCVDSSEAKSNNMILSLIEPIYDAYCKYLEAHNEIDFNDMINMATQYVQQGKYVNPYKYVIVDEYQDISKARFSILESMRKSNDYALFCVGDDWQSIYRFNGSDIGYILNFERYWGPVEISKIETTYRFTQTLIEISSNFVMCNPMQIRKSIQGKYDENGFPMGEISGYTDKYAIDFMVNKLNDLPRNSSVYFIGRYSFDVDLLKNNSKLNCYWNNTIGAVEVKYNNRPDLKMNFITAHKSKGLQADYVFIINNKKSKMGFPSKMQDAPILKLLLDNCDQYRFAEERRLFYVALTRAKKKVYLVTVQNQESEFVMELKTRYDYEIKKEQWTCPECGGRLIKRQGRNGEFWGCSNFRDYGCRYTRNIK